MKYLPWLFPDRVAALEAAAAARILILDGAMGTMIQGHHLTEADYRGERFAQGFDSLVAHVGHIHDEHCNHGPDQIGSDLKGNNDLLTLTQPAIIQGIHSQYLEAGADLIETNTFNSTAVSQADYALPHLVTELNRAAARLVRSVCDEWTLLTPHKPRFAVGVIGPTSRTASISPDVNNPGFRATSFAELGEDYQRAAEALIDGGADIIMVETIFDTLNAKAALFAIERAFETRGGRLPIMISGTITDRSGRTLSGQTAEAFWYSLRHAQPFAIGLNCALGAKDLRAHVDILAQIAECRISAHPNAGLPNAFGEYDESPADMAKQLREFAASGLLNIVGGCCGTSPAHIRAIAEAVADIEPRVPLALQAAA